MKAPIANTLRMSIYSRLQSDQFVFEHGYHGRDAIEAILKACCFSKFEELSANCRAFGDTYAIAALQQYLFKLPNELRIATGRTKSQWKELILSYYPEKSR